MPKAILARWKRKIIFSLIYFSYEDKLTYHVYISHQEFDNCMGLLLISDENKSYYVYVKDFNRFMFNKTRCKNKKKNMFVDIVYSVLVVKKFWQSIKQIV